MHWSSKILTKYKRDAITGELHRAKRIANDFNFKVSRITFFYQLVSLKISSGILLNISIRIKMIL